VKYRRTDHFKKAFRALPRPIQKKARDAFLKFQQDPRHPSLHIKRVQGTQGIWEGRVDRKYRFTFHYEQTPDGETICVFRNIDNHDECLKHP